MASKKRLLRNLITSIHLFFDSLLYKIRRILRIGHRAPITLLTYRGFGKKDYIYLQGRVLKEKPIVSTATDSSWKNLRNNFRRLWSVEIRNASLKIEIGDNEFDLKTDKEGFFKVDIPLDKPLNEWQTDKNWYEGSIHLISVPWKNIGLEKSYKVLMPTNCQFGVISDIDDTIIRSEVTSLLKLKMFYLTFLKNASKRRAIKEVGAFFQALNKGRGLEANNPIFYVSKSPWNLYDLLEEFLQINNLPLGPLLLRDYGLPYQKRPKNYRGHKYENIARILSTYPQLPFILIGDSGEKDTDLYLSIALDFPGRISAIYIRDLKNRRRINRIKNLIEKNRNVEIHLVINYQEAASHAATKYWLSINYSNKLSGAMNNDQ